MKTIRRKILYYKKNNMSTDREKGREKGKSDKSGSADAVACLPVPWA
jgi:hypothetical protein